MLERSAATGPAETGETRAAEAGRPGPDPESLKKAAFRRNLELETLLAEVNDLLGPVNERLRGLPAADSFPVLPVFGAARSGTTLFMQWLASTGLCAYPSNLLSRFYAAPLVGAKLQQLLADPRYAFRDELCELAVPVDYLSANGKTRGSLAPNEFWYFWRRFLPFAELDYLPDRELLAALRGSSLAEELQGMAGIFGKPFALKAMILNQNIPVLDELLPRAIFVWVRRDPAFNIQSMLQARRRQYGTTERWYSFRIREFPQLDALPPLDSVAGQIFYTNSAISAAFSELPAERKLVVEYEDFCRSPQAVHRRLCELLQALGAPAPPEYHGPGSFADTNRWTVADCTRGQAEEAYLRFAGRSFAPPAAGRERGA